MRLKIKFLFTVFAFSLFGVSEVISCDDSGAISVSLLSQEPNGDLIFRVIIGNGEDSGDENGPNITLVGPGDIVSFEPSILCGDNGFPATGTLSGNTIDYDNSGVGDWADDSYLDVLTIRVCPNAYDGQFEFQLTDVNLDCDDDLVYSDAFDNPNLCPVNNVLGTASGWNGEEMDIPLSLAVTQADIMAAVGPIRLQVCSMGDISSSSEYYDITDEDGNTIVMMILEDGGGDDCPGFLQCESIVIDSGTLSGWAADGSIDFTVTPSDNVDDFCENNDVTLTLLFDCPVEFVKTPTPIPTLGQWGLIVLFLLLTIVGVKSLAKRQIQVKD